MSDLECMEGDYYLEKDLSSHLKIVISVITNDEADESDCPFVDGWGYYLILYDNTDGLGRQKEIIGKMIDEESAIKFWTILKQLEKTI